MTFNFLVFLVFQVFRPLFMRLSVGTHHFRWVFQVFQMPQQQATPKRADGTPQNTYFFQVFRPESKHWRGLDTWNTWNTDSQKVLSPKSRKCCHGAATGAQT